MKHVSCFVLVAALVISSVAAGHADPAQFATKSAEDGVKALALQWFLQMQAGKIDRTQYTPAYGALLTDDAVKAMSHHLNQYGASPTRAEILQRRSAGAQTFYMVKLLFPRGDAASILLGLDSEGKITAISIVSMAGD
ncbi:hypothetical protein [Candidatus Binatus sp.]|uniref:hypothetical protein n=1 Tax=Candidatus Binatus sp. TaxID=2811406 RepID=UPI003C389064